MGEIQSLTALRGFAAVWIVLHHFWPQTDSTTPFLISKGYLAVDLFFILSGVVLYLVYADALRRGQFDIKRFALKRFARLYPVHIVTLIIATIVLVIGPKLGFSGRQISYDFKQMTLLHVTLLHAWGITPTGGLNYPSWSLSAEAFAYILFPLLAWLVIRTRHALTFSILFLIATIIALQLYWPDSLRKLGDNLVFTRLENDFGILRIVPEFILGIAIAKHTQFRKNGVTWLSSGVILTGIGLSLNLDAPVVLGFAALIGAGVVLNPKAPAPFRRLGELSYSIYMVHAIVQIVGFKVIETFFVSPHEAASVTSLIPMTALTMLCALAMNAWCERPARDWLMSLATTRSAAPKDARSFPM